MNFLKSLKKWASTSHKEIEIRKELEESQKECSELAEERAEFQNAHSRLQYLLSKANAKINNQNEYIHDLTMQRDTPKKVNKISTADAKIDRYLINKIIDEIEQNNITP